MNKLFPNWITANAIIPSLIKGNIEPVVTFDPENCEVGISLVSITNEDARLIPEDSLELFINTLVKSEVKVMRAIGFNPSKYIRRQVCDKTMYGMVNEIKDLIRRYELNGELTVEGLLLSYMGVE